MHSETFSTPGGIIATVRSRSRRTLITEARYKQALRQAYPSIEAFERAQFAAQPPKLPIDDQGKYTRDLTPIEQQAWDSYDHFTRQTRIAHELGANYFDGMTVVAPLLARIMTLGGASFHVDADGCIPDEGVKAAFEDWLNDEDEPDGFWTLLSQTIQKLDAPLTTVEQKPPETLTPEEQADPLSEKGVPAISSS